MPIHIEVGKLKRVAIVFSCPGRHEEIQGRPAAKTTGDNLNKLLSILSGKLSRGDLTRGSITITNAWPNVEYEAKTRRSEATDQEILTPRNIEERQQELNEITDFVIFCGEKAKLLSGMLQLKNKPKYIYVEHLGTRGLLSIKKDVSESQIVAAKIQRLAGSPKSLRQLQVENTEKRLAVVAADVIEQLKFNACNG